MGMSPHPVAEDGYDDRWQTPGHILDAVRCVIPITTDPCAPIENNTRARLFFTEREDGLAWPWVSDAFVNPPYGPKLVPWTAKVIVEARSGIEILYLVPARVEVMWYRKASLECEERVTLKKRIQFLRPPGDLRKKKQNAHASSIFYFGPNVERFRFIFGPLGELRNTRDWDHHL